MMLDVRTVLKVMNLFAEGHFLNSTAAFHIEIKLKFIKKDPAFLRTDANLTPYLHT